MPEKKKSENSNDPRHIARLLAVQFLFSQYKAQKLSDIQDSIGVFEPSHLLDIIEEKRANLKIFEQLVEGVNESMQKIDKAISQVAKAWPIEQINPVDLTIIRCAIWEAFIGQITPEKVVINEAIELGKELSTEEGKAFINGVLGKILVDEKIKKQLLDISKNE